MAFKDVQMKAFAIKDLLIELENQKKEADAKKKKEEEKVQRLADIEKEKKSILSKSEADNEDAAAVLAEQRIDSRKPASVPIVEKPDPALDKINFKEIEQVPVKVTERLPDNQYRVAGFQFITIRNRPYKLIVNGTIRSEDFSDGTFSTDKMFDSNYELVHTKKAE